MQKYSDLVLVVGEAGIKSTLSDTTVGIHGPLRAAPLTFGTSVEEVTLHLSSNSTWKAQNAEYQRHDGPTHQGLPGSQTVVLFGKSPELQPCCRVKKLEALMAWALQSDLDTRKSRLPNQKLLQNDTQRLYGVVLQTMRKNNRSEVAVLPNEFIDPLALRWLRSLRWLACQTEILDFNNCPLKSGPKPDHFTLDSRAATTEELEAVPGISPAAAKAIRANRDAIQTREDLQNPDVMHDAALTDSAYVWARWFVHGREDRRPDSMPYNNEDLLVDVLFHRLMFANQDPKTIILTADLAKTLYKKSTGAVHAMGIDNDGLDVFVDAGRPLQGPQPIIFVASAPIDSTLVKTKSLTDPLTFPAVRQRDLIGEVGVLATNRDRTVWFRIGFAPDHNFNRLDLVTLASNDATVTATSGKISDAVNQANLVQFNAGKPLPFVPGNLPGTLDIATVTTPAIAFGYSIQHQFQTGSNKNKKITIKSDSKEWNFYFRQHDDTSSQPRFRIWIENSVKIPIWGNLSLSPGFDMFVYRSKPDSGGSSPAAAMTFTSWRPTVSLDYSFDWKRGMKFSDSLRFENAKPQ